MNRHLRQHAIFGLLVTSFLLWSSGKLTASIAIGDYVLQETILSLPVGSKDGNPTDFSGITYNQASDTLFIVDNRNNRIYEYNTDGTHRRTLKTRGSGGIAGFNDLEGIVWLERDSNGIDRFAVTEERRGLITLITIDPAAADQSFVDRLPAQIIDPGIMSENDNFGLEGIAYDRLNGRFLVAKEKNSDSGTGGIYSVEYSNTSGVWETTKLIDLTNSSPAAPLGSLDGFVTDVAGLHYNESNGSLYIISEESKRILDVSLNASIGSSLPGLVVKDPATQVEGITFSTNYETMYVVGESRELYIYYQNIEFIEETGSVDIPEPVSILIWAGMLTAWIGTARRRRVR